MYIMYEILGRTALNRDLVLKLGSELRGILSEHKGQKLSIAAVRQLIIDRSHTTHDISSALTVREVEEALHELESEGVVQIMEQSLSVLVRR